MFDLRLRLDHHRRPSSGTECSVITARWMAWRADCPTRDLVYSPPRLCS